MSKKKVSLHGNAGYFHGSMDDRGAVTVHGPDGEYLHGDVDKSGNVSLHSEKGHYHGTVSGKDAKIHGPNGDYLHGTIG